MPSTGIDFKGVLVAAGGVATFCTGAGTVFSAAGFAIGDITFIDIAFVDLDDLPQVNELFSKLFPEGQRPARTVYQAAALPYGGRVKVMGVAIRDATRETAGESLN